MDGGMKWIDFEKSPPKYKEDLLVATIHDGMILWAASVWYDEEDDVWVCDFTDDNFNKRYYHNFTHWMPLPPPPNDKQQG